MWITGFSGSGDGLDDVFFFLSITMTIAMTRMSIPIANMMWPESICMYVIDYVFHAYKIISPKLKTLKTTSMNPM